MCDCAGLYSQITTGKILEWWNICRMFVVNCVPWVTGDVGHDQCTDLLIANVLLRLVTCCWSGVLSYVCMCS
jgi:hypothetical protein